MRVVENACKLDSLKDQHARVKVVPASGRVAPVQVKHDLVQAFGYRVQKPPDVDGCCRLNLVVTKGRLGLCTGEFLWNESNQ